MGDDLVGIELVQISIRDVIFKKKFKHNTIYRRHLDFVVIGA
jgi:hypothetical protein